MRELYPGKIILPIACLLVFAGAVISGGIYGWYRDLFIFASFMLFLLSLAGQSSGGTARLLLFLPSLAALLSSFWTINLNNTLKQSFFLTGLAFFAFAAASAADGRGKEALLKTLVAAAAVVSVYGIYQYFFGLAHTEDFVRQAGLTGAETQRALVLLGNRRAFSTLMSPNILACYLASVTPVIFSFLLKGKNKLLYGAALAAVLPALFLTKSIDGLLSLGGGLVVFSALLFRQGRLKAKTAAILALVLALAAGAGLFAVQKRSGGEFSFRNSVIQRRGYYAASLEIAKGHALLGRGAGSFQILYPGYKKPGADETRYAHSLPLQYLTTEGVLGIAAVAALFIFFFYNCARKMRDRTDESLLFAAVASGGTAFLIHNLFDFSWYIPETAAVFWLFMGLSASGDNVRSRRMPGAVRLALSVLSLIFIYFFSMSYIAKHYLEESLAVLSDAGITSAQAARSTPVPPEAVSMAEDAVRLKPYDDGLHAFLAGLYEGRALADGPKLALRAESEYGKAIGLNPEYPFYYRDLGILYMKLGQKEKAAEAFRKAVSLYPTSDSLKKYLSLIENR